MDQRAKKLTEKLDKPFTDDLNVSCEFSDGNGSAGDDNDGWEKVSYEDLKMDGMADPFTNGVKKMARDYRELSDFAVKYESWTLKELIVKANDDVR